MIELDRLHQRLLYFLREITGILLAHVLALCMVHVAQIVQRPSLGHSIAQLLGQRQMPVTTNGRLIKPAHHLQRIPQISRRLGLAQLIIHRPSQRQVQLVVLHRLGVVAQVKVGVAQLAVDGTQCAEVVGACLDGRLKKKQKRLMYFANIDNINCAHT